MKAHIVTLPGDGVGPEVTAAAVAVLQAVAEHFGHEFTFEEHAIGGCKWHVLHPGGRIYSARPVNAAEAESRRRERFSAIGHTPGRMVVADELPNPSFPMTLDLRWPAAAKAWRE